MKKWLLASTLAAAASLGWAQEIQEMGRVISATPITRQVGVPRQVCSTEWVSVPQRTSGAGAVIGAIAGGALANAASHGRGQGAVTMIGAIGGAMIGDQLEQRGDSQTQQVQRCQTQTFFEPQTVAYDVMYVYAGHQYHMQTAHRPGKHVLLQVSPVGAGVWVHPAHRPPAPRLVRYQPEPRHDLHGRLIAPPPSRHLRDGDGREERHDRHDRYGRYDNDDRDNRSASPPYWR